MYSTATEEFELYCDREIWIQIVTTIFFLGQAIGALLVGQIADKFGRRPALIISELLLNVTSIISAFNQNFALFVIMRFLNGMGYAACYISVYNILFELVPEKYVILLGFGYESVFNLGNSLLALVAYFIRDWQLLQLVVSVAALPAIVIPFWVPESLRWLVTAGRFKEAKQLARRQAKMNGVQTKRFDRILDSIFYQKYQHSSIQTDESKDRSCLFIVEILRMKVLNVWLIVLAICWFILSSAYFGIVGAIVPGDIFVNVAISGMLPLVACPISYPIAVKFGRKPVLVTSLVLCGTVSCLIAFTYYESNLATQILAHTGRLLTVTSFSINYVYTLELIPTSVRASGLAFCSSFGRFGSFITPWVAVLSTDLWGPTSFLIYGSLLALAGLLAALFLPETINTPIMDTLEETQRYITDLSDEPTGLLAFSYTKSINYRKPIGSSHIHYEPLK